MTFHINQPATNSPLSSKIVRDNFMDLNDRTVPPDGETGQMLVKKSADDFDTQWIDPPTMEFEEGEQQSTGETWIDGKAIMRRTISATCGNSQNTDNQIATIPNFGSVVRFEGYCETNELPGGDGYAVPIGYTAGGSAVFAAQIRRSNGAVFERHGDGRFNGRPIVLVVYYVER